jgi:hypothetical protein
MGILKNSHKLAGGVIMETMKLEYEQSMIDKYVKLFYPKISKNKKPILDGITDVEKYVSNEMRGKPKICWVLKEPYDEKDGYGGGFDLRKSHHKYTRMKYHDFGPTWRTVGIISYSILNNCMPLKEILELESREYMQSLLDISFINISKMPSKTGPEIKDKDLWEHYESWRPILNWQLEKYDPNIIIFGNTDKLFWDDLELGKGIYKKNKNGDYVLKDGKMYILVYNPGQRTISREDYFNGIINAVKKGSGKNFAE